VQVTAGKAGPTVAANPCSRNALMRGVCGPMSDDVKPTMLMTAVRRIV